MSKPKSAGPSTPVRTAHICLLMTVNNLVHNTGLNSSDNLPFCPSDNHHSSFNVYQMGEVT